MARESANSSLQALKISETYADLQPYALPWTLDSTPQP